MEKFLDAGMQKQVREFFSELKEDVEIILFTSKSDHCEYCAETGQLLDEVAALSEKIHITKFDLNNDFDRANEYHVDKAPGFVIAGKQNEKVVDYGIRYYGIPAGHEFASLVNDILLVSSGESGLSTGTLQYLEKLSKPVHLMVFVTPSCPYCPQAVILAHRMALASEMVQAEMVEATEFPELAQKHGVSGVPQTTINHGAGVMVGASPEDHLVQEIQKALGT